MQAVFANKRIITNDQKYLFISLIRSPILVSKSWVAPRNVIQCSTIGATTLSLSFHLPKSQSPKSSSSSSLSLLFSMPLFRLLLVQKVLRRNLNFPDKMMTTEDQLRVRQNLIQANYEAVMMILTRASLIMPLNCKLTSTIRTRFVY